MIALIAIFIIAFFSFAARRGLPSRGRHPAGRRWWNDDHHPARDRFDRSGRNGDHGSGCFDDRSIQPAGAAGSEAGDTDRGRPATNCNHHSPPETIVFIAERFGVILMMDANRELQETAFLDLTDRVLAGGIEQGLLGLAFHPDYANNGRFYVYYTDQGGRRQLSEFQVSVSDPNIASPDTEGADRARAATGRTDIRHYAGNLAFGPTVISGCRWATAPTRGIRARTRTPCSAGLPHRRGRWRPLRDPPREPVRRWGRGG